MLAEVVERLGVIGLERERALETEPALVELQHLLQDDAKIVPGARQDGRERHRPPPASSPSASRPLCRHISAKSLK